MLTLRRLPSSQLPSMTELRHFVQGRTHPLAAFAEDLDPFEPLEDVAFSNEAGGALETFVL